MSFSDDIETFEISVEARLRTDLEHTSSVSRLKLAVRLCRGSAVASGLIAGALIDGASSIGRATCELVFGGGVVASTESSTVAITGAVCVWRGWASLVLPTWRLRVGAMQH